MPFFPARKQKDYYLKPVTRPKQCSKVREAAAILNGGACSGPDHGPCPCPCPGHILYLCHYHSPGPDLLHYLSLYFDSDAGPCHLVLCACYSPYHPDPFLCLCFSLAYLFPSRLQQFLVHVEQHMNDKYS
jgi:hypothetical protein